MIAKIVKNWERENFVEIPLGRMFVVNLVVSFKLALFILWYSLTAPDPRPGSPVS